MKQHLIEAHTASIDSPQKIEALLNTCCYPSTTTDDLKNLRLMAMGCQSNGKGKKGKKSAPADPMLSVVRKRVKFDIDAAVVTQAKLERVSIVKEAVAVDVIVKKKVAEDVSA